MNHSILRTLLLGILLSACSSSPGPHKPLHHSSGELAPHAARVADMLYSQYTQWRGTPYRYGGLNASGIDCSGLVHLVYDKLFSMQLPRTTAELRKKGRSVPSERLLPGDLLFFNTGWFSDHVGIYMQGGTFLHASASSGVRVSNLTEPYWHQSFEMAKRMDIR